LVRAIALQAIGQGFESLRAHFTPERPCSGAFGRLTGFAAGQVAMEQIMACGLGPCYICVRTFEVNGKKEMRRVCVEGPVFDLQECLGW
jgi:hypothetical protein